MKVVHIGAMDGGGGAGNAMMRLHAALEARGVESSVLVQHRRGSSGAVATFPTRLDAGEGPVVRDAVTRNAVERNRSSSSNTHFTIHLDGADLTEEPSVAAADVVNLHWTGSFLAPADVRRLLERKPVVWTLHDLEPVTGGCHFPGSCDHYTTLCDRCPQLRIDPFGFVSATHRDKIEMWRESGLTFVAPSHYLAACVGQSAVATAAGATIVRIPNAIDVERFRPRDQVEARTALGLPFDVAIVLCGANDNSEERKGLAAVGRIVAAARAFGAAPFRLVTFGEPPLDTSEIGNVPVEQLGAIPGERMPLLYAAADLFLHPAIEENFPYTVLEALACGTPVVAFSAGGVNELVQHNAGGRVVPVGGETAMAVEIASLVNDRERCRTLGAGGRAFVASHFSARSVAEQYVALYERATAHAPAPERGAEPSGHFDAIADALSLASMAGELAIERARHREEPANGPDTDVARYEAMLDEQLAAIAEKEAELSATHATAREREAEGVRKQTELAQTYEVLAERQALVEHLHELAASLQAEVLALREELERRDELVAIHGSAIDGLRGELDLIHRVAAERGTLVERLHATAAEQAAEIERLHAELGAAPSL